jgi:hypothetical protein
MEHMVLMYLEVFLSCNLPKWPPEWQPISIKLKKSLQIKDLQALLDLKKARTWDPLSDDTN